MREIVRVASGIGVAVCLFLVALSLSLASTSAGALSKRQQTEPLYGSTELVPPSAPLDVTAMVGRGELSVTWSEPENAGSFPVSNYLVESRPEGLTCVTEKNLSCAFTRVNTGSSYTFLVRALSGAGWSEWSEATEIVTVLAPENPSIRIRGKISNGRMVLVARTQDIPPGASLTIYVRRANVASFTEISPPLVVNTIGVATWSRRWKISGSFVVYAQWQDTRSSEVRLLS